MWGANAAALADEIAAELAPDMRIDPRTGAERELKRRIELAVALLLNAEGIPTRYPQEPRSPRPLQIPVGPPWYRALLTGWIQ